MEKSIYTIEFNKANFKNIEIAILKEVRNINKILKNNNYEYSNELHEYMLKLSNYIFRLRKENKIIIKNIVASLDPYYKKDFLARIIMSYLV